MRRWCAMAALGALQACGSTGEDPATPEELGAAYNDVRQDLIDTEDRLLALPVTDLANLPVSGSATYEGQAGLVVYNPVDLDLSLLGEATVTADFGQGTVAGQATDFIGIEGGLDPESYDGTLALSGGQIGTGGPSGTSGELSGRLTSDDHELVIDAAMQGGLVGNPDVEGILLYGGGNIATVDGLPASGLVGIAAER